MELKDTIELMQSANYKDRFKAEYYQTKIRHNKLDMMCRKYQAGTLDFTPTCPLEVLKEQRAQMAGYINSLEIRATLE